MNTSTAPYVRKNVWTLPSADPTVAEYSAAVATMMTRPASDPTSWTYQAAMHGTHATSTRPLWNGCQHGTWFFLAWHRLFIYYFEKIVRAAVVGAGGSTGWALPFWDYGAGGEQATLPNAFRGAGPAGHPNPLHVAKRRPGINTGLALPTAVTSAARALARPGFVGTAQFGGGITGVGQFSGQYGEVETTPHNDVHDFVGGNGGVMADPQQAAADPIFWLHHANIDRLWYLWSSDPAHTDPSDPRWTGQKFSFFDANGTQVQHTPADVLDIVGQLGYEYEGAPPAPPAPPAAPAAPTAPRVAVSSPGPPASEPEREPVGGSTEPVQLTGVPATVEIEIDERAASAALAGSGGTLPDHVYLSVSDIEGEQNPGSVYGMYVNLPAQASPQVAESHHAGNLSFFGLERAREPQGDEPAHGLAFTREITALANKLVSDGEWDGTHVTVTFRPLGLIPHDQPELSHALPDDLSSDDPPVTVGSVTILYG